MSKWTETTLGKVASIITGPFGSQLHQSDYVEVGIPIVMPQNIDDRKIDYSSINYISEEDARRLKKYRAIKNDILYARRGDIEKHAFITEIDDGVYCGTGCLRVRVTSSEVDPLFLSFFLNKEETRKWLVTHAVGTNMPNLNTDILSNVPVSFPPLVMQKKVIEILKSLDSKIAANNKINDNLQHQLKLMYDYWFTQFDFPDERGKPYRSSGGQMIWNDRLKRNIPAGWQVLPLSQIMKKNVLPFDYSSKQPAIDLSVMPSDTIALSEINTSDNFTTNLFEMKKGDILFGSIRPYLHKAGFAPCDGVVTGTVHSYRAIDKQDSNFALLTIACDTFFDYAVNVSSGTKMPVVSSDSILAYNVPYNSEVVKRFGEISIVETIANNIQENQRLIALRDWLLPMLMNGQATIIG